MAQLSPDKNLERTIQGLESSIQDVKVLAEKCEEGLKKQCEIMDEIELEKVKQEPFEKRSWSTNLLKNTRPFDKGFIKTPNFPSVFQKKSTKVAPEQRARSPPYHPTG